MGNADLAEKRGVAW